MGCKPSKLTEKHKIEITFGNPFHVLPEEIWLAVLENVTGSEDIYNLVEAFPQLKRLLSKQSHIWLIDDVLPLILPKYLNLRDIRSCRLVCKTWNSAVASTFETHPDRLPYNSDRLSVMTLQHFNYEPTTINIKTDFDSFVDNLENLKDVHCRNYNPFPGRLVEMNSYHKNSPHLGIKTTELLEQFGHCIWYIELTLPPLCIEARSEVLAELNVHCLSNLVNLKSLKIKGRLPCEFKNKGLLAKIPAKLETLNLIDMTVENESVRDNLITNLVWHRSLRKLVINMEIWKKKYSSFFPVLTELKLKACTADFLPRIKRILKQIRSPELRKLHIVDHPYFNVYDIMRLLVPYKIESLVLRGPLREKIPAEMIVVPTLLELNTRVHRLLKYKFFQCMPALQYLTVGECQTMRTCQGCYDPVYMRLRTITFDLEGQLDNRKSIWEELPHLKFINVQDCYGCDSFRQYVREEKKAEFTSKLLNKNLLATSNDSSVHNHSSDHDDTSDYDNTSDDDDDDHFHMYLF